MTAMSTPDPDAPRVTSPPPQLADPRRTVTWRRVPTPVNLVALALLLVGSVAQAFGTVVAGQLAESPAWDLVRILALVVVGGSALDMFGRFL
ncbi:MAG TPA: hypothetical protein PLA44_14085, partial [Propionibacteriaceae bacterium]|nr:hypothetical protein [Propionibacteriaceae bacterium]